MLPQETSIRVQRRPAAPEVSLMDLCPHTVQSQPELYKPMNPVIHCNRMLKHFGGRVCERSFEIR